MCVTDRTTLERRTNRLNIAVCCSSNLTRAVLVTSLDKELVWSWSK